MKRKIKVLFAATLLFEPTWAFAQTNTELRSDGIPVSTNGAANTGKSSNSSAGQIAQQIGQSLLSQGTAMMPPCAAKYCGCCPKAAMLIGMGILGLMQSAGNKSTANQHGYITNVSYQGSGGSGTGTGVDGGGTDGGGGVVVDSEGFDAIVPNLSELSKYGVNYKNGKFTLPNGKSFSLKDIGNPQAMANAGVSAGDYASAMGAASDLEKKALAEVEKMGAHTKSQGFENGVGSGSGGAAAVASTSDSSYGGGGGAKAAARDPAASVAGMTKSYNGELIGVAGDSLFEMMARRYRQKSREESFLAPDSAPVSSN